VQLKLTLPGRPSGLSDFAWSTRATPGAPRDQFSVRSVPGEILLIRGLREQEREWNLDGQHLEGMRLRAVGAVRVGRHGCFAGRSGLAGRSRRRKLAANCRVMATEPPLAEPPAAVPPLAEPPAVAPP
jgi:hypothetical protein